MHNAEKTCGEYSGGKRKARKCAQNCSSDGQTLFAFPSMFKNVKSKFILNHENVMRYVINVELLHWAVCSWLHTIYNHPFWFYMIILGFRCKQWVKLAGNRNLLSYKAQDL